MRLLGQFFKHCDMVSRTRRTRPFWIHQKTNYPSPMYIPTSAVHYELGTPTVIYQDLISHFCMYMYCT